MAMIRTETEMKDSGIEYVGAIPKDWDLVRLRAYFGERKNKNKDGNETNLLSLSYGRIIRKNIDKTDGLLPASFDTYNIVEKNDIIIRPTDLQNDKRSLRTGLVTEHGIITSAYIDLMPIGNVDSRFVHYLLHSYDILKVFYNMGSGVRQGLNYSEFSKLKVPMPLLSEQQAIADYLDETCSQIDETIAEAKASIDEYKELKQSVIFEAVTKGLDKNVAMKDSGIEWIGKTPVDWNIAKINRVAWTTSGATPLRSKETEYYDNAVIRWVRTLDLNNGHVTDSSEKITETALKNSSCSIMPVKTVCVAMYGGAGTIGKSGILEVECATNQAICSIVSDKKVLNPDYLHYVIMAVRKYWMKYAVGTRKDPNINQQIIAQMRIPIPQLSKQDIIVNHLDNVTDKCDSLIAEKESLINDLEAYKKSLIYEVVTGKRRVV